MSTNSAQQWATLHHRNEQGNMQWNRIDVLQALTNARQKARQKALMLTD